MTTFREVRQPIERDDEEARQLLRLSQLEGRDPLQDAVAGRLALDRLDAVADRDVNPQHARWADELRRELRERFNDIAPTKFEVADHELTGLPTHDSTPITLKEDNHAGR